MSMERPYSTEDLAEFYTSVLSTTGITSKATLETAAASGRVDLALKVDEIIPPEKQEEILRNNPNQIEVAGKPSTVTYEYDSWTKRHRAKVTVYLDNVWMIEEAPALPSGRKLTVEVIREGGFGSAFTAESFDELKEKTRNYLTNQQWEKFRYSSAAPKEQRVEGYDPLTAEPPPLPQPVKYGEIRVGIDPISKAPITEEVAAHPALIYESGYNSYKVVYFPDAQKAKEAQQQTLTRIEENKAELVREQEIKVVKAEYEEVQQLFAPIGTSYSSYGLSWEEQRAIRDLLWEAESKVSFQPREAKAVLVKVRERVAEINQVHRERIEFKAQVEQAELEKMGTCPCCGGSLYSGECNNEHDPDIFKFEKDDYGDYIHPLVLSDLKVVLSDGSERYIARMLASASLSRGGHPFGQVYIRKGSDLRYYDRVTEWTGEIGDIVFTDYQKVLTPKEVESLKAKASAPSSKSSPTSQIIRGHAVHSATDETEGSMAVAFRKAAGTSPVAEITTVVEGSGKSERAKLEKMMEEAIRKAEDRITELDHELQQQKEKALDLSSRESETEFVSKGSKVIITFNKRNEDGVYYAEIVEWPKDRVIRVVLDTKHQGEQFVELEEENPEETFYSEEFGIPGIVVKSKLVDLRVGDKVLEDQRKKLEKFEKRLNEL